MIEEKIKSLILWDPSFSFEIRVLPEEEIYSSFAPNFIAIYATDQKNNLENCGFLLQQLDLFLSAQGMGTCWYGMGAPRSEFKTRGTKEFVILLAFGNAEDTLRSNLEEFRRKKPELMSENVSDQDVLNAVRLAPSAVNSQPWFLVEENGAYHLFRKKNNPVKALILDKFNRIDMGIALYCLTSALAEKGFAVQFSDEAKERDGFFYLTTVRAVKLS